MADTTIKVDGETRDRLHALAQTRGTSIRALVEDLSRVAETQEKLGAATSAFDTALSRPGFADAFDARYGGLPAVDDAASRAA